MSAMFGAPARALFPLPPETIYLDHGGYGLTPTEVLAARAKRLAELEAAPAPFFAFDCRADWARVRDSAAARLGVRAADLALIDNATDGAGAVLRSLMFQPGDEVLVTSSTYGAVVLAARHIAEPQGARIVRAALRFPYPDPMQCVDAVRAAITPRTRLAILDQVTSGTALKLPLADMIAVCRERGVPVLADGAHAPGHVATDIATLGADWYVANLHKWLFVPRACGVLWASPSRHAGLAPNTPSWDVEAPFPARFAWTGTRDPTPWLCVPDAFAFMDRFGEAKATARNRALLRDAVDALAEAWGLRSDTPDGMTGCMTLVPLPDGLPFAGDERGRLAFQQTLWRQRGIVASASFTEPGGRPWLRISAQIYNTRDDYEALARAVMSMRASSIEPGTSLADRGLGCAARPRSSG